MVCLRSTGMKGQRSQNIWHSLQDPNNWLATNTSGSSLPATTTYTQPILPPGFRLQIITTVPGFYMCAWDQNVRSSCSHCKHYTHWAIHPQPSLSQSLNQIRRLRCQDSVWKPITSTLQRAEFANPALVIFTPTLLCGIHCYFSRIQL